MLQPEPHPQPAEESYNPRHYDVSCDYRKTLYIQKFSFEHLRMLSKWLYKSLLFSIQHEKIQYTHCLKDFLSD